MDDLLATLSQATGASVTQNAAQQGTSMPRPLRNNNPGAVSPGGSVAQYPDMQTGLRAMDDNLASYAGKSDAQTLAQVITKWVGSPPNAPAYIKDVTGRLGIGANTPVDLTNPAQRQAIATAIMLHENGPSAVFAPRDSGQQTAPATPAPTTPGQSSSGQQPSGYTGPTSDLIDTLQSAVNAPTQAANPAQHPAATQPQANQPQNKQSMPTNIAEQINGNPVTDALETGLLHFGGGLVGNLAGLGAGAKKLADTLDPSQAWQAYQSTAGKVGGAIESLGPNANTQGSQVGGYVADIPGRVVGYGLDKAGSGVGYTASKLGASDQTSQKLADLTRLGGAAALTVLGARKAADVQAPSEASAEGAAAAPAEATAQGAATAEPVMSAAQKPKVRANGDGTFTQVSPGQPAAPAPSATPVPNIASLPPAASGKASDIFPLPDKTPTVAGPVSDAEQAQNRNLVNALGLNSVRDSVITGDAKQAGIEYENAKDGGPVGNVMTQTIAGEQNAIRNYANQVNDMTGRDASLDPEGVGRKILAPFQKIGDWFDQQAGKLYSQARQAAGNVPLAETPTLTGLMGDLDLRDRMSASPAGQTIYNAVQNRFSRFTGLADQAEEGAAATPARTIENAENFRQWLNAVGRDQPQFGNFISQVKQALDTDVASVGGDGLFKQARSMWQQRQQMLSDPAQLAKVIGDGSGDLNRSIPLEKVGQRVVGMDGVNFRNVLGSLTKIEQLAPELAPDVQGAIAEIRGQAARQLTDAGGKTQYWNGNQFSTAAQGLAPKLQLIFNKDEIGALRTLNEAGRRIRQPSPYPGAQAQAGNMFRSGIATALPYAANAAGHAVGGTVGGFAGQLAGNRLSSLVRSGGETAAAKSLAKRYSQNVNP